MGIHTLTPASLLQADPNVHHALVRLGITADLYSDSISAIEQRKGISPDFASGIMEAFLQPDGFDYSAFRRFDVPTLVDYLRRSHMSYRDKRLPETLQLVHHLMSTECITPVLMAVLHTFVRDYRSELLEHFAEEEAVLFPYALALHAAKEGGRAIPANLSGYSSEAFVAGHRHLDDSLGEVRKALRNYCVDGRRFSPCHILLHQLRDLEKDLRVHELIEDRVLIPKLREMEQSCGFINKRAS